MASDETNDQTSKYQAVQSDGGGRNGDYRKRAVGTDLLEKYVEFDQVRLGKLGCRAGVVALVIVTHNKMDRFTIIIQLRVDVLKERMRSLCWGGGRMGGGGGEGEKTKKVQVA
jgi:hypothetical protein